MDQHELYSDHTLLKVLPNYNFRHFLTLSELQGTESFFRMYTLSLLIRALFKNIFLSILFLTILLQFYYIILSPPT